MDDIPESGNRIKRFYNLLKSLPRNPRKKRMDDPSVRFPDEEKTEAEYQEEQRRWLEAVKRRKQDDENK